MTYNKFLDQILVKWWDFMDKDCTAKRPEYTQEEQTKLINEFLSNLNEDEKTIIYPHYNFGAMSNANYADSSQ